MSLAAEYLAHGGHSHSGSGSPWLLIALAIAVPVAIITGVWLVRRRG